MQAAIIDCESTGFHDAEVIELAWRAYDQSDFTRFAQRYQPTRAVEWGALAVHHILPSDLVGMPPSSQAFDDTPDIEVVTIGLPGSQGRTHPQQPDSFGAWHHFHEGY